MFSPKALVLLVETRQCSECGREWHTPALEPRVKVENHRGEETTISLQEYAQHLTGEHRLKWFGTDRMPHELQYVLLKVAQCINCFAEGPETTELKRKSFEAYRKELAFAFQHEIVLEQEREARRQALAEEARRNAYTTSNRKAGSGRKKKQSGNSAKPPAYVPSMEDFK